MAADRATIDTMNKVLDGLFGTRRYAKGSFDEIPVGQRRYPDDLKMLAEAGISEEQLKRLMGMAQVSPTSQKMIQAKDKIRVNQAPIIRNQQEVSKIREAFLKEHTRDALVTTSQLTSKYSERAVKDTGYFARLKQLMSSPRKLQDTLKQSFEQQQQFSGRPIFDKTFKTLGQQTGVVHSGVAHNLKFIEELNRLGKTFDTYRGGVQASRERGGSSGWANLAPMLSKMGSRQSTQYVAPKSNQQTLTPIQLPSNPAASTQKLAEQFVAERQRQQTMQQASSIGQSLSRSNFMKSLSRANKSPQSSGVPNLNFMGDARSSRQYTFMDKLRAKKNDIVAGGLQGLGIAGLLGVGSFIGGIGIPMPFKSGGQVNGYAGGSPNGISLDDREMKRLQAMFGDKDLIDVFHGGNLKDVNWATFDKNLASQYGDVSSARISKDMLQYARKSLYGSEQTTLRLPGDISFSSLSRSSNESTLPSISLPKSLNLSAASLTLPRRNAARFATGGSIPRYNTGNKVSRLEALHYYTGDGYENITKFLMDPRKYKQMNDPEDSQYLENIIETLRGATSNPLNEPHSTLYSGLNKTKSQIFFDSIKSKNYATFPMFMSASPVEDVAANFSELGDILQFINPQKLRGTHIKPHESQQGDSEFERLIHMGLTVSPAGKSYERVVEGSDWGSNKSFRFHPVKALFATGGMIPRYAMGGIPNNRAAIAQGMKSLYGKMSGNPGLEQYFSHLPVDIKSFDISPSSETDRSHYNVDKDVINLVGKETPTTIEHEMVHARISPNIFAKAPRDLMEYDKIFGDILPNYAWSTRRDLLRKDADPRVAAEYGLDEMFAQMISTPGIEGEHSKWAENFLKQEGKSAYSGTPKRNMAKALKLRGLVSEHFGFAKGGGIPRFDGGGNPYEAIRNGAVARLQLKRNQIEALKRVQGLRNQQGVWNDMQNMSSSVRSPVNGAEIMRLSYPMQPMQKNKIQTSKYLKHIVSTLLDSQPDHIKEKSFDLFNKSGGLNKIIDSHLANIWKHDDEFSNYSNVLKNISMGVHNKKYSVNNLLELPSLAFPLSLVKTVMGDTENFVRGAPPNYKSGYIRFLGQTLREANETLGNDKLLSTISSNKLDFPNFFKITEDAFDFDSFKKFTLDNINNRSTNRNITIGSKDANFIGEAFGLPTTGNLNNESFFKPYKTLMYSLRNSKPLNQRMKKDIKRFDNHVKNTSSDVIDKLSGAVINRGIPGRVLKSLMVDDDIIKPDPAYQFMSISPDISKYFGSAMLKYIVGNDVKNNIGFISSHELEFILGRDTGFQILNSDKKRELYNVIPRSAGEIAFKGFAKNIPTRALGGDTFNIPQMMGPNSQISADAVKRLQLLRIRAQAGNRLAGLRGDAQLNMQLGNTALFRSPETAGGVINERVLRNLQSMFSGQKMGKFATGGSTFNNPIRVSDGELGIPRGMVDKIGLNTLRRLNAGDMSSMGGFAGGGLMEFDGPGTGTSDSILTDADRGPKGQDASDIGFIIRRTSSDRLKSVMGRAMGGSIPGFIGGGNPFTDLTDFSNRLNARVADPKTGDNIFAMPRRTIIPQMNAAMANNPSGSALDIYKSVVSSEKYLKTIQKNVGFERGAEYTNVLQGVLEDVFGQKIDVAEPIFGGIKKFDQALDAVTKSLLKQQRVIDENTKIIPNRTKDTRYAGTIVEDTPSGTYRGELDYARMRGSRFGETDVTGLIEGGPENPPTREELLSQEMGPRSKRGSFWNTHLAGIGSRFMKELINPTAMQYRVQGNIEMPIGAVGYETEEQRSQLESNRREYNTYTDTVINRFRNEFKDILGSLDIDNLVKVTQGTKQANRQYVTGVDIEQGKDGIGNVVPTTKAMQVEIGTIQVDATALQEKLRGKMNPDEFHARSERAMRPSERALSGIYNNFGFEGFEDGEQIQKATVNVSRFHEEIKKVNMTQTGLYKMGDILRGISWRFASLSMSAMGVYFSIQGLMMTFQQGIGAITTPLADIETLMKNIGMSTAFGDGIMNASKAMDQLNVKQEDFIEGWKNLTNIQATIQTLFASIGSKVFGGEKGREFTDNLLRGITDAFAELDAGDIGGTIQELLSSIVEALPAIVPAIKGITAMLQTIADNPALVAMGAQLMVISLILQPITSGLAAIVTIGGGFFTLANLFKTTSLALYEVSVAAKAAGMGMAAFGTASARALVIATGWGIVYEIIANIVNMLGVLGDFKLPTITGWAMNAFGGNNNTQGFANGGVVQSEGYDQVPGSPDDTIITAKAGEVVIDPKKKRQGFANAPAGGLMPSAMAANPAEETYNKARTAGLMEDGNRTSLFMKGMMDDTKDGNAWNVNVLNFPAMFGGTGEGSKLPFDIGSAVPERLYGRVTPEITNGVAAPSATNVNPVTGITPVQQLQEQLATPVTANPNAQPNAQPNAISPNFTGYMSQAVDNLVSAITTAITGLVTSIKNAFTSLIGTLTTSITSLVTSITSAFKQAQAIIATVPTIVSGFAKSIGTSISQSISDIKQRGVGNTIKDSIVASVSTKGRGNAAELWYQHGGQREWSDFTDYGQTGGRTGQGFKNWFNTGGKVRKTPPGTLVDASGKTVKSSGRAIMTPREMLVPDAADWLQPLAAAISSNGDPLATAYGIQNMVVGNVVSNAAQGALQRGALSAPAAITKAIGGGAGKATLRGAGAQIIGKGLGAAGTFAGEAMQLAGAAPIVMGTGLLTAGEASDKYFSGELTAEQLKQGQGKNEFAGLIDSGAFSAAFGKGMEVWSNMSGKDDQQMISDMNKSGILDVGLSGLYNWAAAAGGAVTGQTEGLDYGYGKDIIDSLGTKLKGGNEAASDLLRNGALGNVGVSGVPLVGDLNLGGSLADLNSGIYDLTSQLTNLDLGNIFGMGTAFVGAGATGVELAQNTTGMVAENPMSALQLGLTAGVPLAGPFLAALGMPQTTEWMTETKGYGTVNADMSTVMDSIPENLLTANQPVVSGLDIVNTSITTGNGSMIDALQVISTNTAPSVSSPAAEYNKTAVDQAAAVQASVPQTVQININVQGSDKNEIANTVMDQVTSNLRSILQPSPTYGR